MARNTPRGAKWKFVHNAFILRFAQLALSLDKIGCVSEMLNKVCFSHFYFAFRSTCTIFAA